MNPSLTLRIRNQRRRAERRETESLRARVDHLVWSGFYHSLSEKRTALARAMAWGLILSVAFAWACAALSGC